jgi:hypothetical protein
MKIASYRAAAHNYTVFFDEDTKEITENNGYSSVVVGYAEDLEAARETIARLFGSDYILS